ncbi:hypothetical protein BC835DRAFT_1334835 [Cytidiella melzeri]|nr:hypothetical protein BC835DRAFT_1334835 [Cytidiella melzeri]
MEYSVRICAYGFQVNKESAQVLLRWCLQHGFVLLTRSQTNPARIESDANLYGFALSDEGMTNLDALAMSLDGANSLKPIFLDYQLLYTASVELPLFVLELNTFRIIIKQRAE